MLVTGIQGVAHLRSEEGRQRGRMGGDQKRNCVRYHHYTGDWYQHVSYRLHWYWPYLFQLNMDTNYQSINKWYISQLSAQYLKQNIGIDC